MNISTEFVRPDTLTRDDYIFDPKSAKWQPVRDAYWSEDNQIFVVYCGPLGLIMHTYGPGERVTRQRYY